VEKGLSMFHDKYQAKYPKIAEHWIHIRTTNPIESRFATIHPRTKRSKGFPSIATMELMVLKMIKEAEKTWRRLRGKSRLPKLIIGVKFNEDVKQQN
jgi:putative transposase